MNQKIAVLGAGAMGTNIGVDLTRAGLDVVIIDQWPAHVEAMNAHGVRVTLAGEQTVTPVRAHHLCEFASLHAEFDIVLLAAKSYDSRWLSALVAPYLKADGVLVGVQNGMNDADNAEMVGPARTLGCVVELSGEVFEPGVTLRNTRPDNTWFWIGELDGQVTPRLELIRTILGHVGRAEISTNILGAKWTKLIANSMTTPFSALGIPNQAALQVPGMIDFSARVGHESFQVGAALGYEIETLFGMTAGDMAGSGLDAAVAVMKQMCAEVGPRGRNHAIHDYIKGRRSEIGMINGLVVREGERLGIQTPYNAAVVEVDRRMRAGSLAMNAGNLAELVAAVAPASA
jgi:2-dehydropantoate 2-reductase